MKKVLILVLATLVLVGGGCSSTNKINEDKSVEIKTANGVSNFGDDVEKFSTDQLFSTASDDAGFRIYFPKYIPDGLEIDKKFTWTKDSATIPLIKNVSDINFEVVIQQNLKTTRPNTITKRVEKLVSREEVQLAHNTTGFFGYYEPSKELRFNTILLTSGGVDIGVWSKTYDKDALIKIANSLVTISKL
mgnify:CR=1 FL=1